MQAYISADGTPPEELQGLENHKHQLIHSTPHHSTHTNGNWRLADCQELGVFRSFENHFLFHTLRLISLPNPFQSQEAREHFILRWNKLSHLLLGHLCIIMTDQMMLMDRTLSLTSILFRGIIFHPSFNTSLSKGNKPPFSNCREIFSSSHITLSLEPAMNPAPLS